MITCETTGMAWTVEGKIENLPGGYGGDGAHVGIDDLTNLLAEHVGKWAKVRVELIEGPRPLATAMGSKIADELKRMRSLATRVRKHIAMVRATRAPANVSTVEEQCLDSLAETMLVICHHLEQFDRRLQTLEGG